MKHIKDANIKTIFICSNFPDAQKNSEILGPLDIPVTLLLRQVPQPIWSLFYSMSAEDWIGGKDDNFPTALDISMKYCVVLLGSFFLHCFSSWMLSYPQIFHLKICDLRIISWFWWIVILQTKSSLILILLVAVHNFLMNIQSSHNWIIVLYNLQYLLNWCGSCIQITVLRSSPLAEAQRLTGWLLWWPEPTWWLNSHS